MAKFGLMILTFIFYMLYTIPIKSWIKLFTPFYLLLLFRSFFYDMSYISAFTQFVSPRIFYFISLFLLCTSAILFFYISRCFPFPYFYIIIFYVTTASNFVREKGKKSSLVLYSRRSKVPKQGESVDIPIAIITRRSVNKNL